MIAIPSDISLVSFEDAMRRFSRVVVIDLETSGQDPHKHSILEFGAIKFGQGKIEQDEVGFPVYSLVCRGWEVHLPHVTFKAQADPTHLEQSGRDLARVHDPDFQIEQEATRTFLDWLGDEPWIFAGSYPQFEFLKVAAQRAGFRELPFAQMIDLHSIACAYAASTGQLIPNRGFAPDHIPELLGLPPEPKPHRASTGALGAAQCLLSMLSDM